MSELSVYFLCFNRNTACFMAWHYNCFSSFDWFQFLTATPVVKQGRKASGLFLMRWLGCTNINKSYEVYFKMRKLLVLYLLIILNSNTNAASFDIDGDLSDWGVRHNGNASDWVPTANMGIQYTIEDQNTYKLEPGFGGQRYDAEALYAHKDIASNTLFIALATGHNPETSNSNGHYGAGDFAIDFGRDGTFEVGINIKPSWDGVGVLAGVYQVTEWAYGLWDGNDLAGYVKFEHPTSIVEGDKLGLANLAISGPEKGYGEWDSNHNHYFYEMSLSLDLLTKAGWQGESFDIHWTENCGNDSIIVDPPASVPAPGTIILLLFGAVGLKLSNRSKVF